MLRRFVQFALVGAAATGIQYLILIALVRAAGLSPPLASSLGFVVSAGGNYWLNYRFTFRSDRAHGPAIARFALLAGIGLLMNAGLMKLLTAAGWHYLLAQIAATAVVLLWNFLGNSLWTFGGRAAAAQ